MTKIYTRTVSIDADIVDAFCSLQKGFTDQFVYYDKLRPVRYMGLGRCVALASLEGMSFECAGADQAPIFFSFNRFDAGNLSPADELFSSFPNLRFMLPEIVLMENDQGTMLQVNSLGPVYPGRVERFVRASMEAPERKREVIPYVLEQDSREQWNKMMDQALSAIQEGRVSKVVLSRRKKLVAKHPFSSKDLLVNLIDGQSRGTVIMYRYADVFFCGCTPELLVRKCGQGLESMCLAGTCSAGTNEAERTAFAKALIDDAKNRAEHDYVVRFMRDVLARTCYNVDIPNKPDIMLLAHVQHLHTSVRAQVLEGVSLWDMASDLHPTPATAGSPVGEAKMLIRHIEPYNRGFYVGTAGFVDGNGNGEFSVALRTGVFDGEMGWVYAGCGIVAESDADAEYEEIDLKLQTILSAFG